MGKTKPMKIFLFSFFTALTANSTEITSKKYTIDSDSQSILANGGIRAVGHVHGVSGNLTIEADDAVYHRENPKILI